MDTGLPSPKSASELLDMYYLEMRCNLLEAAASFDRLKRADGFDTIKDDPRLLKLRGAVEILSREECSHYSREFLDLFSEK